MTGWALGFASLYVGFLLYAAMVELFYEMLDRA